MRTGHCLLVLGFAAGVLVAMPQALSGTVQEDPNVRRGRIYLRAGKHNKAVGELRTALARDKNNAQAHLCIGQAYVRLSEFDKARMHLARAVELLPRDEVALRDLGRVYLELATRQQAAHGAEKAQEFLALAADIRGKLLALPPAQKESYEFLLTLARKEGKPGEALRYVDKVLEIDPKDISTHLDRIGILTQTGELDEAEKACRRVLDINPKLRRPPLVLAQILRRKKDMAGALKVLTVAAKQKGHDAAPRLARAELYLEMGRPDDAMADADAVLRTHPRSPMAHFIRGAVLFRNKKLAQATDEFQRAVAGLPNHLPSHYWLARCYLRQDKLSAATERLNACLAINPAFTHARLLLANALLESGHPDAAIKTLQDGVRRTPHTLELRRMLATAYMQKGDQAMAMRQYEQVAALDPNAPLAHQSLASLALAKGDNTKAIAHCERALAAEPHNAGVRFLLGLAYLRQTRYQDARREFEQVLAKHPQQRQANMGLVSALVRLGEFGPAEKHLQRLIDQNPAELATRYHLATLYTQQKAFGKAENTLKQLLSIEKDKAKAHLAMASLHHMRGDGDKAIQAAKTALVSDPKRHVARIFIARQHLAEHQWVPALEQLKAVCQKDPSNPAAYDAAVVLFFLGRHNEAVTLFEQAMRNNVRPTLSCLGSAGSRIIKSEHRGALATLTRVKGKKALATPVILQTANAYLAQGALTDMTTCIQHAPQMPDDMRKAYLALAKTCAADKERRVRVAHALARIIVYGVHGWHQQALDQCDAFLMLVPATPTAHLVLANTYAATSQADREGDVVQRLVKLDPTNTAHRHHLARYYLARGRADDARRELAVALKATPKNPDLHATLAAADLAAGDHKRCVAHAQEALALRKDHTEALALLARGHLAAGKPDEAATALEQLIAQSPNTNNPRPVLQLAGIRLRQGQPSKAIAHYRHALSIDDKDLRARFGLATALENAGRTAEAIDQFKGLSTLDPTNDQALLALARLYQQGGRLDLAYVTCTRARGLNPASLPIRTTLARIQVRRRNFADAIAEYKTILEEHPKQLAAHLGMAEALFESGDHDTALAKVTSLVEGQKTPPADAVDLRAYFLKRLGRLDQAQQQIEALVRLTGQKRGAYDLAILHLHHGRFTDALRLAASAGKHYPGPGMHLVAGIAHQAAGRLADAARTLAQAATTTPSEADVALFVANAHLAAGKPADARKALEAAKPSAARLAAYNKLVETVGADAKRARQVALDLNFAALYARTGWLALAQARYQAVLATVPDAPFALFGLADVHARLGQRDQAIAIYHTMVRRGTGGTAAMLKLALAHRAAGNHAKAVEAFRALVKTNHRNLRYTLALAAALSQAGQPDEAIDLYRTALRQDSRSISAHNNLAWLYATSEEHKNLEQAEALALRAVSLVPSDSSAAGAVHDTLAWVHYLRGDFAKAATHAQKAVSSLPQTASVCYHAGMIELKRQHLSQAVRHLALALKLDPDLPDRPAVENILKRLNGLSATKP